MSVDPERQKLDDLAARIHKASGAPSEGEPPAQPTRGGNAGYEFAGTILGCLLIGWLIDNYAHTSPWGIVGMMVIGFIAGVANVWRALGGYERPLEPPKQDGKT